jgi:hypothetical protein
MMDKQKAQCLSNLVKAAHDLLDCSLTSDERIISEYIFRLSTNMEEVLVYKGVLGDEDEKTHQG